MNRPVSEHLAAIERVTAALQKQAAAADDMTRRELEIDIRSLNIAKAHYELAIQIESDIMHRHRQFAA